MKTLPRLVSAALSEQTRVMPAVRKRASRVSLPMGIEHLELPAFETMAMGMLDRGVVRKTLPTASKRVTAILLLYRLIGLLS